jgi:hypothetical protein
MRVRFLGDQDLAALRRLAAARGPAAWEQSGIDPARPPMLFALRMIATGEMMQYRTLRAYLPRSPSPGGSAFSALLYPCRERAGPNQLLAEADLRRTPCGADKGNV